MPVTPYLFFDGRCEEALNFYKTALGAEIGMMMRFKDNPEPPQDESCGRDRHRSPTRSCMRPSRSAAPR